ncbi:uncharacterized protein LOC121385051 [Gigantopelta aegis]|uniref:uncharacterized protein LOC121385051 n=1 Tax=Gigantopelta aegis TaxID=1735272 RepID=UPI001B88A5AF|nr:uncharacterized protein LOC121385051 [Gigantopelta aegis]
MPVKGQWGGCPRNARCYARRRQCRCRRGHGRYGSFGRKDFLSECIRIAPIVSCPRPFRSVEGKCIYCSNCRATFAEASTRCRKYGGQLYKIKNIIAGLRRLQRLNRRHRRRNRWTGGVDINFKKVLQQSGEFEFVMNGRVLSRIFHLPLPGLQKGTIGFIAICLSVHLSIVFKRTAKASLKFAFGKGELDATKEFIIKCGGVFRAKWFRGLKTADALKQEAEQEALDKDNINKDKCVAIDYENFAAGKPILEDCNQRLPYCCEFTNDVDPDEFEWTKWINTGRPRWNKEYESYARARRNRRIRKQIKNLCIYPRAIKCRVKGGQEVTTTYKGKRLARPCGLWRHGGGIMCRGRHCPDFEIKVLCEKVVDFCALRRNQNICRRRGARCKNKRGGFRCVGRKRRSRGRCSTTCCTEAGQCQSVGICSVSGDPHYRFFDACGKKIDFMGVCTYLLSETTVIGDNLLPYSCKVQNHKRRNPKGRPSWTDYVVCTIGKYTIKLGQKKTVEVGEPGAMMRITLPWSVDMDGYHLEIVFAGRFVKIKASNCLEIMFDGSTQVQVRLPMVYQGKVRGICGNFNGKNDVEFLLRDGTKPTGSRREISKQIGDSWLSDEQYGKCTTTKVLKECTAKQLKFISDKSRCGMITDPKGKFKAALAGKSMADGSSIDDYLKKLEDQCMIDYCNNGQKEEFCDNLGTAAHSVKDVFADCLVNYFAATKGQCKPECGRHSTYRLHSACENTCADLDAEDDCNVDEKVLDCACDEGFVRQGKDCVPPESCGCTIEGHYLKVDDPTSFFIEDCTTKFTCVRNKNGDIEEKKEILGKCSSNARCKLNGQCVCNMGYIGDGRNCKPEKTIKCIPPYKTFGTNRCYKVVYEEKKHDDAALSCALDVDMGRLARIDSEADEANIKRVLSIHLCRSEYWIGGNKLVTQRHLNAKDMYKVTQVDLPQAELDISGEKSMGCSFVRNARGRKPRRRRRHWKNVRKGKNVGKFNRNRKLIDKKLFKFLKKYKAADKLKVPNRRWHYGSRLRNMRRKLTLLLQRMRKKKKNAAWRNARETSAARDFADCFDTKSYICEYDPEQREKIPKRWSWKFGISALPRKKNQLREWVQNPKILRAMAKFPLCKSPTDIRCYDGDGKVIKSGDGGVICNIKKGFRCKGKKCRKYKVQFECPIDQDECRLFGDNACLGNMMCYNLFGHYRCVCPPGQIFDLESRTCGADICHCSAWGDPHPQSCLGTKFHFQGECKYLLTGTCPWLTKEQKSGLNIFKVEVKNFKCGKPEKHVTCTHSVFVTLYDADGDETDHIVFGRGDSMTVNGVKLQTSSPDCANQPYSLKLNKHIWTLETRYGLMVNFDGRHRVNVQVPRKYIGKLCGLCGAYTVGDLNAQFVFGNQSVASVKINPKWPRLDHVVATDFGNSWQVNDPEDPKCKLLPHKPQPTCKQKDEFLTSQKYCNYVSTIEEWNKECVKLLGEAIIRDWKENCVLELCANAEGVKKSLCQSLENIINKCTEQAKLKNITDFDISWRTEDMCGLKCENDEVFSNYECELSCGDSSDDLSTCKATPGRAGQMCVCKEGMRRDPLTKKCIPVDKCGCINRDVTPPTVHKKGDVVLSEDCQQKRSCLGNSEWSEYAAIQGLSQNMDCKEDDNHEPKLSCKEGYTGDGYTCTKNPKECTEGWTQVVDKCVKIFLEPETWIGAIQTCNMENAVLVSVTSDAIALAVKSYITTSIPKGTGSKEFFIAGVSIKQTSGGFVSLLASKKITDIIGYENFIVPKAQFTEANSRTCFTISTNPKDYLKPMSCLLSRAFICEERPEPSPNNTEVTKYCSVASATGNQMSTRLYEDKECDFCPVPMGVKCRKKGATGAEFSGTSPDKLVNCAVDGKRILRCNSVDAAKIAECLKYEVKADCYKDVDECEEGLAGCDDNQECINLYGAYKCVCKNNYIMFNGKCEAVDTCTMTENEQGEINLFSFADGTMSFKKVCKFDMAVGCGDKPSKPLDEISVETDADGAKIITVGIDDREIVVGDGAFSFIENGQEVPGAIPPITREHFVVKRSGEITVIRTNDNSIFIKIDFRKGNLGQILALRMMNRNMGGLCGACTALKKDSDTNVILTAVTSKDSEFSCGPAVDTTTAPQTTQPQVPTTPPPTTTPPTTTEILTTEGTTTTEEDTCSDRPKAMAVCDYLKGSLATCYQGEDLDDAFSGCMTQMCSSADICTLITSMIQSIQKQYGMKNESCATKDVATLQAAVKTMKSSTASLPAQYKYSCLPECPVDMEYDPNFDSNSVGGSGGENVDADLNLGACVCKDTNMPRNGVGECGKPKSCADKADGVTREDGFIQISKDCTSVKQCGDGKLTVGDYSCTANSTCKDGECGCNKGFLMDKSGSCEPLVTEDVTKVCSRPMIGGEMTCECKPGFVSICGGCQDVDECHADEHPCGDDEECVNTKGSYNCQCKKGYAKLSGVCTDVDECKAGTSPCGDHQHCVNIKGGYVCYCCAGYETKQLGNSFECIWKATNANQEPATCCPPCLTGKCALSGKICRTTGRELYRDYRSMVEEMCLRNEQNVGEWTYGECPPLDLGKTTAEQEATAKPTTTPAPVGGPCDRDDVCADIPPDDPKSNSPICEVGPQKTWPNICEFRASKCLGNNPPSPLDNYPETTDGACNAPTTTPNGVKLGPWTPDGPCRRITNNPWCGIQCGLIKMVRVYELLSQDAPQPTYEDLHKTIMCNPCPPGTETTPAPPPGATTKAPEGTTKAPEVTAPPDPDTEFKDFPVGGVCSAGPFKPDGKNFTLKTEHGDCNIGYSFISCKHGTCGSSTKDCCHTDKFIDKTVEISCPNGKGGIDTRKIKVRVPTSCHCTDEEEGIVSDAYILRRR